MTERNTPSFYDVSRDETRPVTQADVDQFTLTTAAFGAMRKAVIAVLDVTLEMAQGKRTPAVLGLDLHIRAFQQGFVPWTELDAETPKKTPDADAAKRFYRIFTDTLDPNTRQMQRRQSFRRSLDATTAHPWGCRRSHTERRKDDAR